MELKLLGRNILINVDKHILLFPTFNILFHYKIESLVDFKVCCLYLDLCWIFWDNSVFSVFRNLQESHLPKDQEEDLKEAKTRVPLKQLRRWE